MSSNIQRLFSESAIGVFFLVAITFSACSHNQKKVTQHDRYASLSDSTSYTGLESCKSCHADKYESYLHTGMGMSFDLATRKKSSASFSDHAVIYDKYRNFYYHPHWQNDSLIITEFRLSGKDTIFKRSETINWIVGSGQHTNSHLMNVNGYVYQVPATFYTQKGQWDLPPGFDGGFNSRFSRIIGLECMSCHNSYPEQVPGSENKYSFVANGINCERCHGPGGEHVKEKRAGLVIDVKKNIDYTIVNPAKLPVALQLDICQRCHIQGNAVLQEGKTFLDFRPGMKLSDVMNVYMPLYKGDDDSHIMASHAERLKMSRCFVVSMDHAEKINKENPSLTPYKNAMTCVTCHDPHISVRQTGQEVFNQKCKSCHSSATETSNHSNPFEANISCTESLKKRSVVSDNCVSCHMPKSGSIDIPHVTTTDHWIRKPVNKNEVKRIKEFAGLICINNAAAGNRSKGAAYISYFEKFSPNPAYLDSAKKYFSDENTDSVVANFKYLVHLSFLMNDFEQVIKYTNMNRGVVNSLDKISLTNEDAWTSYRIGESFNNKGEAKNALVFFQKSVDLAPYQLDFRNKLAGVQQDLNFVEEARKNYEFILKENPEYSSAYVSLGYLILTTDHDVTRADGLYDKALSLDPDNLQAFFNKAGVQILLGKKTEAINYLREIVKRDKNNEKAKMLIGQLK